MDPDRRRLGSIAVLTGVIMLGFATPGASQRLDCDGMRRRIADLDRRDGGQAARYARSLRKQQAEIDRTVAYRGSLGCDRRQFLVFGDPPPADCGRIDAQIERMNANLAALQESAARIAANDPGERNDLAQSYYAYCRNPDQFAARGDPDRPYPPDDQDAPAAGFRRMPLDPAPEDPPAADERPDEARPAEPDDGTVIGGAKAVCVKTCDGSFFPISYSASRGDVPALEALCHASCPYAETKLYTYDVTAEIDQAVDKEGVTYAELPNAKRYSKIHDPTCSCRAPGKTWLETLAEAERLYAGGKHDIVVTQQMSDALARAATPVVAKAQPRSRKGGSKRVPNPADAPAKDVATAAPKAAEAAPPTHEAAGLDAGAGDLRGTGEDAIAPGSSGSGGSKRRVRVIAPNL